MEKYYLELYSHGVTDLDEDIWIDIESLEIQPNLLFELEEFGIIETKNDQILACEVGRIQKLVRLQRSLEVNIPGAAVIMDLLERVKKLEEEIEFLKRR